MNFRHVAIVFNPIAGKGYAARVSLEVAELLRQIGCSVQRIESHPSGSSTDLEASFSQADLVCVCGGDGTFMRLLPLLLRTGIPVTVFPTGGECLVARRFGITRDLQRFGRLLNEGSIGEHFVATANGTPFFIMASLGLDSCTIQKIAEKRSTTLSRIDYVMPTLAASFDFQMPLISLVVDGTERLSRRAGYLIVANNSEYAGGLRFVPEATSSEIALSSRFFPEAGTLKNLTWAINFALGGSVELKGSEYYSGQVFNIETAQDRYPVQADGEFIGFAPLEIKRLSAKLKVLSLTSAGK